MCCFGFLSPGWLEVDLPHRLLRNRCPYNYSDRPIHLEAQGSVVGRVHFEDSICDGVNGDGQAGQRQSRAQERPRGDLGAAFYSNIC